jgi:hypothetical protein
VTYLSELRSELVQAAHREHYAAQSALAPAPHARASGRARARKLARAPWLHSAHYTRVALASIVLGLTGTAVGAVHVGAPLGPEQPYTSAPAEPAPGVVKQRPAGESAPATRRSTPSAPAS